MLFHHIGIATADIEKSIEAYSKLGYSCYQKTEDPIQQVQLAFLKKENSPILELVAPTNQNSPINRILEKNGTMSYHFCYEVEDIESTIVELRKSKFILTVKPVPAIAFGNRLVAFLYHKQTGLIELLQ